MNEINKVEKSDQTLEIELSCPIEEGDKIIGEVLDDEKKIYISMIKTPANLKKERQELKRLFWDTLRERLQLKRSGNIELGIREGWIVVASIELYA